MADTTVTTPAAAGTATTQATTTTPAATGDADTKIIATPSYSKRVARDLAKLEKERKEVEKSKKEIEAVTPRLKSYEDQVALVKAGKVKEFLAGTGLTREQVAAIYGFDLKTGKELTDTQAKAVAKGTTTTPAATTAQSDELKAIQAKIDALEKAQADKDKKAAEEKTKAEQVTFEANKKGFLDQISKAVSDEKGDTYAYTAVALAEDPEDVRDFMWAVVDAWCQANPTIQQLPKPEVFAAAVEADYEKQAARYQKVTKKAKEQVTTPQTENKVASTSSNSTNSNDTKALTPEQAIRKLKQEWKLKSQQALK